MATVQEALDALGVKTIADLVSDILMREAFLGPWAVYRDTCFWDSRYEPWRDPLGMKPFVAMVMKAFEEGVSQSDCKDTKDSLDIEYHQSLLFSSLLRNLMQQGEFFHGKTGHEESYPGLIKALRKLTTGVLVKHYRDNRGLGVIVERARPSKIHLERSLLLCKGHASIPKEAPKEKGKSKLKARGHSSRIDNDQQQDDAGAVIRCICKRKGDDGEMIQCDKCDVWQHTDCMGLRGQDWETKAYYCEQCCVDSDPSAPDGETTITAITGQDAQAPSLLTPETVSPPKEALNNTSVVLKHDSARPQSQTEPGNNPLPRTGSDTDSSPSSNPLLLLAAAASQATPIALEENAGDSQPVLCYHCGASEHAARDCQDPSVTCSLCDMVGHISNHCPRSALTGGLAAAPQENPPGAPQFIEFEPEIWTPTFLDPHATSITRGGLSTQAQTQAYGTDELAARPASAPPAQPPLRTQLENVEKDMGIRAPLGSSSGAANSSSLAFPPRGRVLGRSLKRRKGALAVRVPASNELGDEQETIMVEHNGKRKQFLKSMGSLRTADPQIYYSSSDYATEAARRLQLSEVPQAWDNNARDIVQDTTGSSPTGITQGGSDVRGVLPTSDQGSSPHPTLRDSSAANRPATVGVSDYQQTSMLQSRSPRLLRPLTSHEVATSLLNRPSPSTTRFPTVNVPDRVSAVNQGASSPAAGQSPQSGSQPTSIGHKDQPQSNSNLVPTVNSTGGPSKPAGLHPFERSLLSVNRRAIGQPRTLSHGPPVAEEASTTPQYSMQYSTSGRPSTHQSPTQRNSAPDQVPMQQHEQIIFVTRRGPIMDRRQHPVPDINITGQAQGLPGVSGPAGAEGERQPTHTVTVYHVRGPPPNPTPGRSNIVRTPSRTISPRGQFWANQLRLLYAKQLRIGRLCRAIARGDSVPQNYALLKITKREYVDLRTEILGYNSYHMTKCIEDDFPLPSRRAVETDWVEKTWV
ncbi:uncharacterized protein BDZ99DRAFT_472848 [Mytilinidion resinicola]|uniref:CCHC-type domain-containing protein n=1 Tax=Mytilinidion resinicola TaxID=574789 RepID=A0A6A6YXN0_9PEZI|nr:uncharacterized protein BDZ99DRAFT_472848 [Mytilinidion resinicola]KAF2813672.1 hypothetical protein BDZ99DRAFT_472848 [Mytilinidion resinicola]